MILIISVFFFHFCENWVIFIVPRCIPWPWCVCIHYLEKHRPRYRTCLNRQRSRLCQIRSESHESHSFRPLLTMPILALEYTLQLQTTLNPSLLQFSGNEPGEPINSFHLSRLSGVARYWPSAISEYRESACLWMTMNLSCWSIFIPRQILEKDVFQ